MGKRKDREWGQQVEGKRMRAESADDQDQNERRRFNKLIERLGPVKFRHLADEWFSAHGKDDGESETMASHGVMENLDDGAGMLAYTKELLKWGSSKQLTIHLTRKLALNDRAPQEVEQDLRQHAVCAVACVLAEKAKVLTEASFLEDDLSSMMSKKSWKLVQETTVLAPDDRCGSSWPHKHQCMGSAGVTKMKMTVSKNRGLVPVLYNGTENLI
jgi:hypothetical protein